PYFGYAPVDVKKGINRLHAGAHGIFGCEYGVSGSFGELTDEGEIHGSVGDYLRTVAGGSRHEKRRYIWHHAGDCVSAVFCHRLDLRLGNTKVVKPFHAYLLGVRSEEHTSELQSRFDLVCRLLLEKKNTSV